MLFSAFYYKFIRISPISKYTNEKKPKKSQEKNKKYIIISRPGLCQGLLY